ncbi:hypothetical protein GX50_07990 [[Emmonsia] crescens]|uniref:Uncharacterized protein n=1 Tax=[Emmonsia] crescens TaxID=73230 RepID=A0A2B7Z6R9_9EURO|nr:hypothetical protein GX50_07990 [Emmonsia crescens]
MIAGNPTATNARAFPSIEGYFERPKLEGRLKETECRVSELEESASDLKDGRNQGYTFQRHRDTSDNNQDWKSLCMYMYMYMYNEGTAKRCRIIRSSSTTSRFLMSTSSSTSFIREFSALQFVSLQLGLWLTGAKIHSIPSD